MNSRSTRVHLLTSYCTLFPTITGAEGYSSCRRLFNSVGDLLFVDGAAMDQPSKKEVGRV